MGQIKDLSGRTFERLTVISFVGLRQYETGKRAIWSCQCECGTIIEAVGTNLLRNGTRSCGCLKIDELLERTVTHGHKRNGVQTAEIRAWDHMKARCYNPNVERYTQYGGRGIQVCDRWRYSFENFYADMGPRPSPKHSLDRFPNVNGNYEPSNCRWATTSEQARCKTSNHFIEYNGEKRVLSDWAYLLDTYPSNINRMLKKKSFQEVFKYYIKIKNDKKSSLC